MKVLRISLLRYFSDWTYSALLELFNITNDHLGNVAWDIGCDWFRPLDPLPVINCKTGCLESGGGYEVGFSSNRGAPLVSRLQVTEIE